MRSIKTLVSYGCIALMTAAACCAPLLAADKALPNDLQDIAARGEIVIGVRESALPFSFLETDGSAAGYTIAICQKIAEQLRHTLNRPDLRVRYNHTMAVTRALLVRENVIDMDCGATSHTASREKLFGFSLSIGIEQAQLVSLAGSAYKSLDELAGKRLLVTDGSTTHDLLKAKKVSGSLKAEIVPVRTAARAYYSLKDNKGDAYIGNPEMFRGELLMRSAKIADFAFHPLETPIEPLAIMLHKNHTGLKSVIDQTIIDMANAGELRALYQTWFEQPITRRGINLGAAPGPEWQSVLAVPHARPAD